jgi:hypothetical protein
MIALDLTSEAALSRFASTSGATLRQQLHHAAMRGMPTGSSVNATVDLVQRATVAFTANGGVAVPSTVVVTALSAALCTARHGTCEVYIPTATTRQRQLASRGVDAHGMATARPRRLTATPTINTTYMLRRILGDEGSVLSVNDFSTTVAQQLVANRANQSVENVSVGQPVVHSIDVTLTYIYSHQAGAGTVATLVNRTQTFAARMPSLFLRCPSALSLPPERLRLRLRHRLARPRRLHHRSGRRGL